MYCYLRLVLVLNMSPVCEGEGECGEEEGGGLHGDDMMKQCPEVDWSPVFTVSYCYPLMSTSTHCSTATPSPELRFLPASRHQSWRGSARRLGKPKWTEKLDPDCRHRVTSDIWAGAWHRAGTAQL